MGYVWFIIGSIFAISIVVLIIVFILRKKQKNFVVKNSDKIKQLINQNYILRSAANYNENLDCYIYLQFDSGKSYSSFARSADKQREALINHLGKLEAQFSKYTRIVEAVNNYNREVNRIRKSKNLSIKLKYFLNENRFAILEQEEFNKRVMHPRVDYYMITVCSYYSPNGQKKIHNYRCSFDELNTLIPEIKKAKARKERQLEPQELSYKQQMYRNAIQGDENSPYYGAERISQSTFEALSDYIYELFGYEKGSPENSNKIINLIGKFIVLPDGDKDVVWPRTNLSSQLFYFTSDFLRTNDSKVIFVFHYSESVLFRKISAVLKLRNIEIFNMPFIKPFSKDTNKYCVLDINSIDLAYIYYFYRQYYGKDRQTLGLTRNSKPSCGSFEKYKTRTIEMYKLDGEYGFMRYLLSYIPFDRIINFLEREQIPRIEAVKKYYISLHTGIQTNYDQNVLTDCFQMESQVKDYLREHGLIRVVKGKYKKKIKNENKE